MIQDREFLVAKLAELDTSEATQQDLEACYYERAYRFYTALSDSALARLADACGEPVDYATTTKEQ